MQLATQAGTDPQSSREDTAAALRTWALGMLLLGTAVAAIGWIEGASATDAVAVGITDTPQTNAP